MPELPDQKNAIQGGEANGATYLDWLRNKEEEIKPRIDALLREHKAQEEGNGSIDLILTLNHK